MVWYNKRSGSSSNKCLDTGEVLNTKDQVGGGGVVSFLFLFPQRTQMDVKEGETLKGNPSCLTSPHSGKYNGTTSEGDMRLKKSFWGEGEFYACNQDKCQKCVYLWNNNVHIILDCAITKHCTKLLDLLDDHLVLPSQGVGSDRDESQALLPAGQK